MGDPGDTSEISEEPERPARRGLVGRLLRIGARDEAEEEYEEGEEDEQEDEADEANHSEEPEMRTPALQPETELEPVSEPMNGAAMSWAELVEAQHGQRRAEPDVPSDTTAFAPAPGAQSQPTRRQPDVRGEVSAISDELKAGIGEFVDDLRSSIRGTSDSARAEIDRIADDLRTQLRRVEEEVGHQTERISDQVGRVDDRAADVLDRLESTSGALRERIDATESRASGLKQDIQELALRIEQGLAESSDRIAAVADSLEKSLSSRIASAGSTAREDNIQLGREVEILTEKTVALEALLHSVLDGLEAQSGPPSAPVKEFTGTLALNSATFEQLRGVGFSVTQAARIIAYRDTRGGFSSMDQLHDVRGLSQEDIDFLADRAIL